MALDGIVMANLAAEMKDRLEGGKIAKIAQPEKDELLFTIKNQKNTWRLLISASASLPLIYFTEANKQSPMTAPNFCMLLRKHIGNGRIIRVSQPGLERIICMEVEHFDELGDKRTKKLIIEIMGKHSNIIFCNEEDMILDSIKHISAQVSSIREVVPGRTYFIPQTMEKKDPLTITEEEFINVIGQTAAPIQKALYMKLTGISPIMGHELCNLASIDGDRSANGMTELELIHLYHMFSFIMDDVKHGKNTITRIRQKSVDLRKIVQTALERNYKKYDLQAKQLKDTDKRDKYKVYGELINTYGYELTGGEKQLVCLNYYTNEEITIPMDDQLSAKENAQKYFDKYNKLKRTFEAVTGQIAETKQEIDHLESVSTALDIALMEEDLVQIKEELMEYGYIKHRRSSDKKPKITSRPFHYVSSDGFHIYVGKNNYQNEELTFKVASGNDWWFHAKGIPGSHVIVKTEGKELPDRAFEEAGALAAYYSKGRENDKVEVDYIQKKQIKKVAGSAPGFVIYHTNYSMVAEPKELLEECK